MDELLAKLKGLPLVGALFKGADGGSTTSEFGLFTALIGVAAANASTMSLALGIALGGIGLGVGLYANSRGRLKAERTVAASTRPGKVAALLAIVILPGLLLGGCAAAGAGADAGLQTHSWSAGAVAAERVEKVEVQVQAWPLGMEKWTPEQIAALAQAMGGRLPGDVLTSRQEVKIGSDQQGGQGGTATLDVRPTTSLTPPGAPGAASAVGKALGVGASPGPAPAPARPTETPPPAPPDPEK